MRLPTRILLSVTLILSLLVFAHNSIILVKALDSTPPLSSITLNGTLGNNGWYTSTVAVLIRSDDLESGVKSITYTLDGGIPTVTSFSTSSNLAPNPSFEAGAIDGWTIDGSASFSQDTTTAKFDTASAKIVSTDGGFKDWQTQSGITLSSGKNYVLAAWVKYSQVVGVGVKLVLDTASTPPLTGTSDWTRVYLNYSPTTTGAFTPKLGIDGPGQVYFDGVYLSEATVPAEVGFVVSGQGNHTLTYFATNNDGVVEATKQTSFKMDTQGPSNWRNLRQVQVGNDHTFYFQEDVDDTLSGLDTSTGQFQYSLDGGATWGYHSNLLMCNSPWITDGWLNSTQSPSSPTQTTTITTGTIDFCDSDFNGCSKKIRMRIEDVAGNFSSKDYCLNSSWFQAQGGDIHSVGNITPSSQSTTDWLASSYGTIGNLSSSAGWLLSSYSVGWSLQSVYDGWRANFYSGAQALPGGKLPSSGSGYYKVLGNYTVDGNTLPANIATADVNAVIFIDGNLSVNLDYSLKSTSSYVFLISGDLLIDGRVQNMSGIYLSLGKFDDHSGGPSNKQLILTGAAWANGGYQLSRDLGKPANTSTPAEKFVLSAGVFGNSGLRSLLSGGAYTSWREVDPDSSSCGS